MTAKHYSAPWGPRICLITGAVILFGILIAIWVPLIMIHENRSGPWWITLPVLAVIGGTSLFMVRGYDLTNDAILVRRSFWKTTVELKGLRTAEPDPLACKGAWKTVGNDGLFAMHGWFRSKRLGKFRAFVTNPRNCVVLRFKENIVVVSPENPRHFVSDLNRRLRDQKGRH